MHPYARRVDDDARCGDAQTNQQQPCTKQAKHYATLD